MKNYTIIYCMDDDVIFKSKSHDSDAKTVVVNYLSYSTKSKEIRKMNIDGILYYEMQIDTVISIIKNKKYHLYNALEQHLLNFIKAMLSKTPDELIVYLTEANYHPKRDLEQIETQYFKKQKYYPMNKKYITAWISKDKISTLC